MSLYLNLVFFELAGGHRDLHVLTHSFPTRRSSDLFTNGPCHDVHIVLFQQSLEPVQLTAQPCLSRASENTADHHVRLTHATKPGTELQAAKANVIFHG